MAQFFALFLFTQCLYVIVGGNASIETLVESDARVDKVVVSNNRTTISGEIYNREKIFEQILSSDYDGLDGKTLRRSVDDLIARGAHRCWHKHSTFLDHLLGVHHILRLWGQGPIVGRVGLFHSAYSNSYVNLALYDPSSERNVMKSIIGTEAEELVYLFCIIDRQQVVVNTLLTIGHIPVNGLHVPHLHRINEKIYLSPHTLRILVVFSMADIAEQYFGWQDELFGGNGSMLLPGKDDVLKHKPSAMWPGESKPGIWMTYVNQLSQLFQTHELRTGVATENNESCLDDSFEVSQDVIPLVFQNCTRLLSSEDEVKARDLYWYVVTNLELTSSDVIKNLLKCIERNPWIFEPLVLLAQHYLHENQFILAESASKHALELQLQWGTAWDKRLQFGAWVAWTHVLHQRAGSKEVWPKNSWDVNNFGFVKQ